MTDDGTIALSEIARELGVKPMSLALYCDSAGSYAIEQAHSTPHRRKLPPRGSPEGRALVERVRRETGTEAMRTLAVRLNRTRD